MEEGAVPAQHHHQAPGGGGVHGQGLGGRQQLYGHVTAGHQVTQPVVVSDRQGIAYCAVQVAVCSVQRILP